MGNELVAQTDNFETVTLGLADYDGLKDTSTYYNILVTVLFSSARLDYSGKRLDFDYEKVGVILKVIEPGLYDNKLRTLKSDICFTSNDNGQTKGNKNAE